MCCITALYAKNTASISTRCSLQIRKSSDVSMPSQLAPNVWILTTPPSAAATKITLICLGEVAQFIEVRRPIHILCLPTASSSATSPNFYLPPWWRTALRSKYIFGYGKPKHDKYIIYKFPHMATLREVLEWESATAFGQYTLSSSWTNLQPHDQGISTYDTFFTLRLNRRYRFNLDTVFTYRSLSNGYRVSDTSRFGNILLLFLLVSTCQISMLTFTTRYHAIYHCGCWCRGSTHLQMGCQDFTAYKTLQQAWPAYRAYTFMDGELM